MNQFAAAPTPAEDTVLKARALNIAAKLPTGEDVSRNQAAVDRTAQYANFSYGQWSIFETEKASKATVELTWFYAASHSATEIWDYEGYYTSPPTSGTWEVIGWVFGINACNHGTCYNESSSPSMYYDCYTESTGWYYNAGINGGTGGQSGTGSSYTGGGQATGSNDGAQGCQTAYSWNSGNGSHLCNDDAAYELFEANHPNYPNLSFWAPNQGSHCDGDTCGSSPSNFTCGGGSYSPSGDWNTPNCNSTNF